MITERDIQNHMASDPTIYLRLKDSMSLQLAAQLDSQLKDLLPSAADLDAIAEEERIKQATGGTDEEK